MLGKSLLRYLFPVKGEGTTVFLQSLDVYMSSLALLACWHYLSNCCINYFDLRLYLACCVQRKAMQHAGLTLLTTAFAVELSQICMCWRQGSATAGESKPRPWGPNKLFFFVHAFDKMSFVLLRFDGASPMSIQSESSVVRSLVIPTMAYPKDCPSNARHGRLCRACAREYGDCAEVVQRLCECERQPLR